MDYDILKTIKDNPGIAVMFVWELEKSYQMLYEMLDLGNIINFNDVEFANSRGAQWKLNGTMEDLGKLWNCKFTSSDEPKLKEIQKVLSDYKSILGLFETKQNKKRNINNELTLFEL